MVQVNKEKRQVTIIFDNDIEDLFQMQKALTELIKHYNYEQNGNSASETIYFGMELLNNITPDLDQFIRGFVSEDNYLELPKKMTSKQEQTLRGAIQMYNYPNLIISPEVSQLHSVLENIK